MKIDPDVCVEEVTPNGLTIDLKPGHNMPPSGYPPFDSVTFGKTQDHVRYL